MWRKKPAAKSISHRRGCDCPYMVHGWATLESQLEIIAVQSSVFIFSSIQLFFVKDGQQWSHREQDLEPSDFSFWTVVENQGQTTTFNNVRHFRQRVV